MIPDKSLLKGKVIMPSGKLFDILNPELDDFDINDIAHNLSKKCRFNGAIRDPDGIYSIAQHSVYVSHMLKQPIAMGGLLHDGTEAYVSDMVTPLKDMFPEYREIETVLGRKLALSFNLPVNALEHPDVKAMDLKLLGMEAATLLDNPEPVYAWSGGYPDMTLYTLHPSFTLWTPTQAKKAFLDRYHELRTEAM
jgi:hypothetical protein